MAPAHRSVEKLRLRPLEANSKDTLKLDVPDPCSLPQLRCILAGRLSPPPPPGSSFRLSLNRTDELQSPDPARSLQSLGLASGDLLYYSLIPGPPGGPPGEVADLERVPLVPEDASRSAGDPSNSVSVLAADGSAGVRSKLSEPFFLRKVLKEGLGGDGGDHRLLVIAVHAVLLESGFVAVNPATGMPADRLRLPDQWPFTMSLQYSLPEIVDRTQSPNVPESVALKFHSIDNSMTVESDSHAVHLDKRRFAPIIDAMWPKGDDNVEVNGDGGSSNSSIEKEVFKFWKIVKDDFARLLLIDLIDRARLPCFTSLPTDMKLSIFELLSGIDLAKVACVSRELRRLTSTKYLWKQKYVEEFGERIESGDIDWKQNFILEKEKKKRQWWFWWQKPTYGNRPSSFRRVPRPFVVLGVIGGDYDRLPGLGIPPP
ncbi:F-box protein SKIP22-like [Eucalyptus grandis]|uniref:F-box protein SKIP22-like n=1 Tax=Eucalyptus grandis TaxID=71139 RepID=UPI00192EAD3E|nr:F-box protein SKIP22-like [Eucalyptus grandis]